MLDLSIPEDQIAESRSRWLPELDSFAKRTSKLLLNTRSLPIHDAATAMASKWLRTHALPAFKKQSNRNLILVGDEHLHRAASSVLSPDSVPHTVVFPSAWLNWCYTQFLDGPVFWWTARWCINDESRLIHFAELEIDGPALTPNESYLLSTAVATQGTDSICRMRDGTMICDTPISEWVDCV